METIELKTQLIEFLNEIIPITDFQKALILENKIREIILNKHGIWREFETNGIFMIKVTFFTDTNSYIVTTISRKDRNPYLGCTASTRLPKAGEDWFRGSDLSDGDFNRETWESIKNSIIKYELVELSEYIQNHEVET